MIFNTLFFGAFHSVILKVQFLSWHLFHAIHITIKSNKDLLKQNNLLK